MSNALAVATVSAVLRSVVEEAVQNALPGVSLTVETNRPDNIELEEDQAAVSLFLYQVGPNGSWRNRDLPTRRGDGRLAERPVAALDLNYLVTFFGNETLQQPERLLGHVVTALEAQPLLGRERIRQVVGMVDHLAGSDLDRQVDLVRFVPEALNLEELSKLWSIFFQTAYRLSVAYRGSVVLLEPDSSPRVAPPVGLRNLYVETLRRPRIDRVAVEDEPEAPIVAGSRLDVRGAHFRGRVVRIAVGDAEAEPAAADLADRRLLIDLGEPPFPAGSLRAGLRGMQIVHRRLLGSPETEHRGVESNAVPLLLRPTIAPSAADPAEPDITQGSEMVPGPEPGTMVPVTTLSVGLRPVLGREQRVRLLLHGGAQSRVFASQPRAGDGEPAVFRVPGVAPGEYLVQVEVDGLASPLEVGEDGGLLGPSFEVTA